MHATLVEALPAGALRPFPESLQIALAIVLEHVMFARHVEHWHRQVRQHLLQRIELGRLRQMRQVAGVQQERRLLGCGLDLGDRTAQRRGDIGIRWFVEADVAVADLHELKAAAAGMCHGRAP